jgi:4'-phosphopantetheinyl transferase EntD
LLPGDLFVWGMTGERVSTNALYPAEARLCAGWCERRQSEFATGRYCAHKAMDRMGVPSALVGRDPNGAPAWPYGVVGSISHTRDLTVAAVAPAHLVRAVGIDVEYIDPAQDVEALALVLQPAEREWVQRRPRPERALWTMILFSARESVYKCVYSLSSVRLGIDDVTLRPMSTTVCGGTVLYDLCSHVQGPSGGLLGRFHVSGGHVHTSTWCLQALPNNRVLDMSRPPMAASRGAVGRSQA